MQDGEEWETKVLSVQVEVNITFLAEQNWLYLKWTDVERIRFACLVKVGGFDTFEQKDWVEFSSLFSHLICTLFPSPPILQNVNHSSIQPYCFCSPFGKWDIRCSIRLIAFAHPQFMPTSILLSLTHTPNLTTTRLSLPISLYIIYIYYRDWLQELL